MESNEINQAKNRPKGIWLLVLAIILAIGIIWAYNSYQRAQDSQQEAFFDSADAQKYFENNPERIEVGAVEPPEDFKAMVMAEIAKSEAAIESNEPSQPQFTDLKEDYYMIAYNYYLLGQNALAEEHYFRLLEKWPEDYKTIISLSTLYVMMGQYQESAKHLYRALELYPNEEQTYTRLASLYVSYSNDPLKADDIYQTGIKNSATRRNIYKEYAYYLERTKQDYSRAVEMWREYEKVVGSLEQQEIDRLQMLLDLE
ncbi:MAG: hypothetical protein PHO91_00195 [Patescibacteria group bacterium]|nr:hypothetical protein [Patescibacteria group bacterium]